MRASVLEVREILVRHRIATLREHRHLRRTLYHLTDRGDLSILYPGVFVASVDRDDTDLRVLAAAAWKPDAVLVGRAAARMSCWRDLAVPVVELASPRQQRNRVGVQFSHRSVPPQWRMHFRGLWMTRPALTALDLVPSLGGTAISHALRTGVAMDQLWLALSDDPHRPGQSVRRRLLRAYRDLPWSEAEQRMQELLRAARIRGWVANHRVVVNGAVRFLDVVMEELRIVIEIDGYAFHSGAAESRQRFEDDREVANWLIVRGWLVLRFTWRQLVDLPDLVVETVRAATRRARLDDRHRDRQKRAH